MSNVSAEATKATPHSSRLHEPAYIQSKQLSEVLNTWMLNF